MKPVYILGDSLICSLQDTGDIRSANPITVQLPFQGRREESAFYQIDDPDIGAGADRVPIVVERVIRDAIQDAGLGPGEVERAGLFVGSTSFNIFSSECRYVRALSDGEDCQPLESNTYEAVTNHIAATLGHAAQTFTFHTACTSSANALLYAARMIEAGRIRHAIVVGFEFFNRTTMLGFHSLDLLAAARIQPFGANRDGMVPGEGCSAIVLGADRPDVSHPIRIAGGATNVDLNGMTSAGPDGVSIASVVTSALKHAGIEPKDIRSIKLHGTATRANDSAEAAGLARVYDKIPPACVLKPAIGHTLGACGTNELVILRKYLDCATLPGLPYDYPLDKPLGISVRSTDEPIEPGPHLLNHFGFGGNNTALVISNGA